MPLVTSGFDMRMFLGQAVELAHEALIDTAGVAM
jgi:hypothetical protein